MTAFFGRSIPPDRFFPSSELLTRDRSEMGQQRLKLERFFAFDGQDTDTQQPQKKRGEIARTPSLGYGASISPDRQDTDIQQYPEQKGEEIAKTQTGAFHSLRYVGCRYLADGYRKDTDPIAPSSRTGKTQTSSGIRNRSEKK
ncbi:Hypothetical predicted protein [Lecanosticta acicola]|uniref:Uncharacterized protein n=1 Tax=Lecanosticta acicola TaxID=111012 RepID=A0AAI9EE77_9PEZI|nr:Hypothetical predicted protein [Lecanosticta acicola]